METELMGLPQIVMDFGQLGIWAVTALGIIGGIYKGIAEIRKNTKVHSDELRWKQADRAATELSRILGSDQIKSVLGALDVDGQKIQTKSHGPVVLMEIDLPWFFRTIDAKSDGKTVTFAEDDPSEEIRNEFDLLFEHLEFLETLVANKVILFEDIRPALTYWIKKILAQPSLLTYLSAYEFYLAENFVRRFEESNVQVHNI